MAQLRQDYSKFQAQEAEIVVVGPEGHDEFLLYWKSNKLPFLGLPDPTHSVLKRYGQEVNIFKLGRMPAQILIDKQGVARYVHYGHSMSDIPANKEILELLETINAEQVHQ